MLVSAPFCFGDDVLWWTWHQNGKKLWLMFFYALLAFGALAKGPVAPALAVLVVGAYAVLRRDGKLFVHTLSIPGFLLFFVIVLPWYLAVQHKVPQFFRVFFVEHNLGQLRCTFTSTRRWFWYYIPVFLLATLPWTVFALPALVGAGRDVIKQWRRANTELPADADDAEAIITTDDGLSSFLFIWIVVPIVFFSISRAKLPGYILSLPVPAAALLTAGYIHPGHELVHV